MMVEKYSHIVENKSSSNAEKNKAWDEITTLFNAEPDHTKVNMKETIFFFFYMVFKIFIEFDRSLAFYLGESLAQLPCR